MKTTSKAWFASIAAFLLPLTASAVPITYDMQWTGFDGGDMTGVFVYDSGAEADGFVRDRDTELVSLSLSSATYGLNWNWDGNSADPFNFNFIVATAMLPFSGAFGSTEAQWWNGGGAGLGLGVQGNDGRIFLTIDGRPREATVSLTVTRRTAPVPEPASLALFGLGLATIGFVRRRKNS